MRGRPPSGAASSSPCTRSTWGPWARSRCSGGGTEGAMGDEGLDELEDLAASCAPAIRNALRFREARRLADVDPLTGLHNRRYFHETLARECARAHRYERGLALLMLDVDDFSAINDDVGHLGGDAVLAAVADRLVAIVRHADVACRVGADSFAIVLPEAGEQDAEQLYNRIQFAVGSGSAGPGRARPPLRRDRRAPSRGRPGLALPAHRRGSLPRPAGGQGPRPARRPHGRRRRLVARRADDTSDLAPRGRASGRARVRLPDRCPRPRRRGGRQGSRALRNPGTAGGLQPRHRGRGPVTRGGRARVGDVPPRRILGRRSGLARVRRPEAGAAREPRLARACLGGALGSEPGRESVLARARSARRARRRGLHGHVHATRGQARR